MNKNNQNKLVPKLRFPEFVNDGEWDFDTVENLISTISPPKKLNSSEYLEFGKFPIVDQSQKFYCGWTNDREALIKNDFPLIIFGDHTCILKLVNEPFAQGADGIKIIKPNKSVTTEYLYHFLYLNGVQQENYKRHFSILKDKVVLYPDIKTGEQQKIAACLSSLDEVITAESQKLDILKDHKKGLLQNLFPQEGETVPNLRFKEFENSGEWEPRPIGEFVEERTEIAEEKLPLYSLTLENGITPKTERYERSFLVRDEENAYKMVCSGDFAYNPMNLRFGAIARHSGESNVAVSKYYNIFYCDNSVDSSFCSFYFRSPRMIALYDDIATGSLIEKRRVHFSSFLNLNVLLPTKEEQEKIAVTLSCVDDFITAQSQKIETLKLHKKGLLQGLFPDVKEIDE